jgi:acetate---CoA ligase (ADP-forming)
VKLLLLYLETLTDPAALAHAAALGRARGVPIIAVKSGRSEDGRRAAASHTGAIATADRVVDAFFEKHGIWRADGMLDLVRAAELYLKGWKPAGRRLAVISNSGATCVLAADAAERAGLPLAQLAPATEAHLARDPAELRRGPQPDRHHRRTSEQQRAVRPGPAGGGRRPGRRSVPHRPAGERARL